MSKKNLFDAYGTPISVNAINTCNTDDDSIFDLEEPVREYNNNVESETDDKQIAKDSKQNNGVLTVNRNTVRFGIQSDTSQPKPPKLTRVWHPDSLFKNIEDTELNNITSFKSVKITEETTAKEICDLVASKLRIDDPSKFRIYSVKDHCRFI